MRIIVTANASWNLVNYRGALIKFLAGKGHDLTALAPDEDGYAQQLEALGAPLVPLEMDNKGLSPIRDFALFVRFFSAFRAKKPDAVLSFTIKNNIYGALAARILDIPFYPNVSGLGTAFTSASWLRRLVTLLYRTAFRRVPAVFFQNPDDQNTFLQSRIVRPDQARLLPGSGVDLEKFSVTSMPGVGGRETTFLLIARMLWGKGVGEFVEAAKLLHQKHPGSRFQLLGFLDVDAAGAISKATMDAWVEEGAVEYLGTAEDVRPYIAAADCIVLPTAYGEGTPRTLLEAASMGRPIITTDTPGCREVVEDGRNGFVCPVNDAQGVAATMEKLIQLPIDDRARLGQEGRKKMVADYDQEIVLRAYAEELDRLRVN